MRESKENKQKAGTTCNISSVARETGIYVTHDARQRSSTLVTRKPDTFPTVFSHCISTPNVRSRDYLLYFYYAGIVHVALKQFPEALEALLVCITLPATQLSAIVIEAFKKYVREGGRERERECARDRERVGERARARERERAESGREQSVSIREAHCQV